MDAWSSKVARTVIRFGSSVFNALARGIQSRTRSVSRDCLIAITWLGFEMATMGPSNLRYSACDVLLQGVSNFIHPGWDLDERVLACQCVYNYASGKGEEHGGVIFLQFMAHSLTPSSLIFLKLMVFR